MKRRKKKEKKGRQQTSPKQKQNLASHTCIRQEYVSPPPGHSTRVYDVSAYSGARSWT